MRYIAHRGNHTGREERNENTPGYVQSAIEMGLDCEIDVWIIDDVPYLGHDSPDHVVSEEWLTDLSDNLWCHAKNIEALEWLTERSLNSFFHDTDDCTLTSRGYSWVYPVKKAVRNSVIVMPERVSEEYYARYRDLGVYGVCSDFALVYKKNDDMRA